MLHLRMTWPEICEHYARQASHMLSDRDGFLAWMNTKEAIGGGRPIAGPEVYAYAYGVARKLRRRDHDHFTVVCGREGSGKSWAAAAIASLVSPTFRNDSILFEPGDVVQAFKTAQPEETVHIDEGVLFLFSRTALSSDNVATTTIFQLIRQRYLHIVVCIPQFKDLDTYVRKHRTDTLVYMKQKGHPRFYLKGAVDIINEVYPKTKNKVTAVKVPTKFWFDGRIRKLFPTINDLSIESYERSKSRNLDETLDRIGSKLRKGRNNVPMPREAVGDG